MQTILHSDVTPERFFEIVNFEKNQQTTKKHEVLPIMPT